MACTGPQEESKLSRAMSLLTAPWLHGRVKRETVSCKDMLKSSLTHIAGGKEPFPFSPAPLPRCSHPRPIRRMTHGEEAMIALLASTQVHSVQATRSFAPLALTVESERF